MSIHKKFENFVDNILDKKGEKSDFEMNILNQLSLKPNLLQDDLLDGYLKTLTKHEDMYNSFGKQVPRTVFVNSDMDPMLSIQEDQLAIDQVLLGEMTNHLQMNQNEVFRFMKIWLNERGINVTNFTMMFGSM